MASTDNLYQTQAEVLPTVDDTHPGPHITVRLALDADARALARLAALDSADPPDGATLLAELDGEAVAALPLAGGAAIADPFRRTRAMVALLELRAAQLRGEAGAERSVGARLRARARIARPLWLSR